MRRTVEQFPYTWALWAVILLHLSLVIWEAPSPLTAAPSSASAHRLMWIELACLLVYWLHMYVVLWAFGASHAREKKWHGAFIAFACLCTIDWCITYIGQARMFRFSRVVRPLLLVATVKTSRRMLTTILRAVRRMVDVALVIIVVLVTYSVIGMQFFSDTNVSGYVASG